MASEAILFSIDSDRFHGTLRNRGWGFWTEETALNYLSAERQAIYDIGLPVKDLMILFDAYDFKVQKQDVIRLLTKPSNPLYNCKRGAFVTPKGLGMMQIRRGNPHPHIGVFETQSEAWAFIRGGL